MRLAEREGKSVVFHAPEGRWLNAPRSEGGVEHNFAQVGQRPIPLYASFCCGYPCESARPCRKGKKAVTRATPGAAKERAQPPQIAQVCADGARGAPLGGEPSAEGLDRPLERLGPGPAAEARLVAAFVMTDELLPFWRSGPWRCPWAGGACRSWPVSWAQIRNMRSTRLGLLDRGLGAFLPARELEERVGAEETYPRAAPGCP